MPVCSRCGTWVPCSNFDCVSTASSKESPRTVLLRQLKPILERVLYEVGQRAPRYPVPTIPWTVEFYGHPMRPAIILWDDRGSGMRIEKMWVAAQR